MGDVSAVGDEVTAPSEAFHVDVSSAGAGVVLELASSAGAGVVLELASSAGAGVVLELAPSAGAGV
eukprot:404511-Hanusia_phi.AAC.1